MRIVCAHDQRIRLNPMRPIGRKGTPTNLYLDPEVRKQAAKLAFQLNISLSELVETVLRKRIARTEAVRRVEVVK